MLMIVGTIKPVEIKTFKLDNGLRVFVVEDHSSPVATVQVWYRVGSRNENYGITGISHLLEHMMFRPSKGIKGDYSQIIDMMGGSDNAFTTRDATAIPCGYTFKQGGGSVSHGGGQDEEFNL